MAARYDDDMEILDLGEGADEGEVEWLEESAGEEQVAAGRDPRRLPPHAPRGRILASALSVALVLGGTGGLGTVAYHRHETDVRVASTLDLSASGTAPSIPGLAELAFATTWHARPSEQVLVPVVNRGPDAVTLLDGRFSELGLSGPATLWPVGDPTLAPGGTGELAGTVTADCTSAQDADMTVLTQGSDAPPGSAQIEVDPGAESGRQSSTSSSGGYSSTVTVTALGSVSSGVPPAAQEHLGSMQVRARSASGRTGEALIFPEVGVGTTAERICEQQGQNVITTSGLTASVDARTHTITVSLAATSVADVVLRYSADSEYSALPEAPGLILPDTLSPALPTAGTVAPGGKLDVAFQIPISRCSADSVPGTDNILLNVLFLLDGQLVSFENYTASAQTLIGQACGDG
jgi:hypothetical protein